MKKLLFSILTFAVLALSCSSAETHKGDTAMTATNTTASRTVKLNSGYEMRRTQERASRVFDKQKLADTIQLNSGFNMPILGLGTWTLTGATAENAVYAARSLTESASAKKCSSRQNSCRGQAIPMRTLTTRLRNWACPTSTCACSISTAQTTTACTARCAERSRREKSAQSEYRTSTRKNRFRTSSTTLTSRLQSFKTKTT